MLNILVYAYRDWSFANIAPALKEFRYTRWWDEQGPPPDFDQFDLIITCEPHIKGWHKWYKSLAGKHKILAMQQGLYWSDQINSSAVWLFDKMMVWGPMMYDVCSKYGIQDRIVVTGNPRFDDLWGSDVTDGGYILLLGSGGEKIREYASVYKAEPHTYKFQPHPNMLQYKMPQNTTELIRAAQKVVFRCTGAGLIAMILRKPVRILPFKHQKSYMPCSLYNSGEYGYSDEFVDYAATGPQSTKRVVDVIRAFANV